ncbi:MAG TPA: hypothetical protein VMU66_09155, partial [Gaiellales bacterium]|nr:hypothetical protein [Gaiellales bacterium]
VSIGLPRIQEGVVRQIVRIVAGILVALAAVAPPAAAAAPAFASGAFQRTWTRTDQPVASGAVSRTWMWGPQPDTGPLLEPYGESPGGQRLVQYFDKARMEITHPNGDPSSIWYVTNGLLARELITGDLQLGDSTFHQYAPAHINVAGDPNDPNAPTYASFNGLMGAAPLAGGTTITQTVNRAGQVGNDPALANYDVTAHDVGAPTHHDVASVFWTFMTSTGTVDANGQETSGPLFPNPFYATGYPLTEAYWTTVLVGGVSRQVLVQVFERRVLTYTPTNPSGWQVESGNVGQHYYQWRYVQLAQPVDELIVSPLPITSVDVSLSTGQPVQVVAHVAGYVPTSCATPQEPVVSRNGQTVTVRIDMVQPAGAVCAQLATLYSRDVPLGSFAPGDYTLTVNSIQTTFHVG